MKPLKSGTQDTSALQELGRASVQIVHDIKNQLNGLKLYATFLRKRMEKSERPQDEQETIGKLIAGLERAAADMTTLVRYGRPVELRRQAGADLFKVMAEIANVDSGITFKTAPGMSSLEGDFDPAALTEAFKAITIGALNSDREPASGALEIHLCRGSDDGDPAALIEWRGLKSKEGDDPFRSFAGSDALRMSLATKMIEAHGGEAVQAGNAWRVHLPLNKR